MMGKGREKTSKGICANPEKCEMHENNQIFVVGQHTFPYKYILLHFFIIVFHHPTVITCGFASSSVDPLIIACLFLMETCEILLL